ncbi:MAG: DNA polymerase Y family protein [Lautropia sp.]|nr:DNA polymerase Y family protein [Lautropia sp.]
MLWACIALPRLPLDIVLRRCDDPGRPLALLHGPPHCRSLLAVNPAARQQGLRAGQRLMLAQAICNDFQTVLHDPADEARWQQWLANWACRFSSQVHAGWPRALVLEVGSSLRLMGGWPALQARLRRELGDLQFRHRIALAPNPCAAHVLAWLKDRLEVSDDIQLQAVLARVPVRQAGLPDDAGERLHRLGIRQLKQLLTIPPDGLRRRFGADVLTHLDELRGQRPPVLNFFRPPPHYDMRQELPYAIEHLPPLAFPLRRMIQDLAAFLDSRSSGVPSLRLDLEHSHPPATVVTLELLAPERDPALLFELLRSRLEHLTLPRPVLALRLHARHLHAFQPGGRDLFEQRPASAVPWEQLRERLLVRLGPHAIHQITPHPDPRPEYAWQRLADDDSTPHHPGQRDADAHATPLAHGGPYPATLPARPGWLLPAPQPLAAPIHRILAGPERIESGWWDGEDVRRDYYILETRHGQRAWAFTPVGKPGPWMLHGWFA